MASTWTSPLQYVDVTAPEQQTSFARFSATMPSTSYLETVPVEIFWLIMENLDSTTTLPPILNLSRTIRSRCMSNPKLWQHLDTTKFNVQSRRKGAIHFLRLAKGRLRSLNFIEHPEDRCPLEYIDNIPERWRGRYPIPKWDAAAQLIKRGLGKPINFIADESCLTYILWNAKELRRLCISASYSARLQTGLASPLRVLKTLEITGDISPYRAFDILAVLPQLENFAAGRWSSLHGSPSWQGFGVHHRLKRLEISFLRDIGCAIAYSNQDLHLGRLGSCLPNLAILHIRHIGVLCPLRQDFSGLSRLKECILEDLQMMPCRNNHKIPPMMFFVLPRSLEKLVMKLEQPQFVGVPRVNRGYEFPYLPNLVHLETNFDATPHPQGCVSAWFRLIRDSNCELQTLKIDGFGRLKLPKVNSLKGAKLWLHSLAAFFPPARLVKILAYAHFLRDLECLEFRSDAVTEHMEYDAIGRVIGSHCPKLRTTVWCGLMPSSLCVLLSRMSKSKGGARRFGVNAGAREDRRLVELAEERGVQLFTAQWEESMPEELPEDTRR